MSAALRDPYAVVADVLKAHFPSIHEERHEIHCACGWKQHFESAKEWHRHAAAMVVNTLGVEPPVYGPPSVVQ